MWERCWPSGNETKGGGGDDETDDGAAGSHQGVRRYWRPRFVPAHYVPAIRYVCLFDLYSQNWAILACISFSFALASQPWISKWQKEKTFWGYQIYMSVFEHHPLSFNRRNCSSHFDRMSLSPDIPDIYDVLAYEQDLTLNGCLCSPIQSPASEDWKLPQALGPH